MFVASPSNVSAERMILKDVIDDINLNIARSSSARLELLSWETQVTPEYGDDPQQVISTQIGDNYSIFIGIIWGRFGTPTPRAASGTIEEFERARDRYYGIRYE